jgi:hypothetical protein
MSLLKEPANYKLLHLVSTPIAIMLKYGLRTYAGVTADDPSGMRNADINFTILLSIFGQGRLLGRIIFGAVKTHEHFFIDIDVEVAKRGWSDIASLCVVHRVPSQYISGNELSNVPVTQNHTDFNMYRTVVQYALEGKGMGSVIYETPPNFNAKGKKPHFLSFSNKIYLHPNTENYLCLLNYSISADYEQAADVKIEFRDTDGNSINRQQVTVPAFDFGCVQVDRLIQAAPSTFASYTAASISSALIPLSIIINRVSGGVSVEHSHPPQEYLMTNWGVINTIKLQAAKSFFGG